MTIRARYGTCLQAAWVATLLKALTLAAFPLPSFSGEVPGIHAAAMTATEVSPDSSVSGADATSFSTPETIALLLEAKPVLARNYAGIDTAALLARIQERLQWGERDERLIEAEGILHWDRGHAHLALACFKKLANPGSLAMGLMGEALLGKGDRYEAAEWFLKSARSGRAEDPFTTAMLGRYLEIRPDDKAAEMQLAGILERQMRFSEAAAIFGKHRTRVAENPETALRVGSLFASQGRGAEAESLLVLARSLRPEVKALSVRLAEVLESLGKNTEAARAWTDAWTLDGTDVFARNRAMALLESSGAAGVEDLKSLLGKFLRYDPASADLRFRLSELLARSGDRKGAYMHLGLALKAAPGNAEYESRLPDLIEGDSLILEHFPVLKSKFEKEGASLRLALLVARGYSLTGDKPKACGAWAAAALLSPKSLEGRRDAFLDLSACGDPASLGLATAIGEKRLATGFDKDAARSLVQIALRAGDYPKAARHAKRLVMEAPGEAAMVLAASRAMLDAGKKSEADETLGAIAAYAPHAEASMLLGRIRFDAGAYAAAADQFLAARDSFPEAIRLGAECHSRLRNFEAAAAEYEAHHSRTGDPESLRSAARMHREAHYGPKELEALVRLQAKGQAGEEELLRIGMLRAEQGQLKKTMEILEGLFASRKALPSGSDWSKAAIMAGSQWSREGKLDQAIHALELGLKSAPSGLPGLAEAWVRLGECRAEKGRWKEAMAAYKTALEIDSLSGEAAGEMLKAAKMLDSKKDLPEALRAVYRVDKEHIEANDFLGSLSQHMRDYRTAAAHFRKVADRRPDHAGSWENLGNALAMIPDLAAAGGPLQTAIDLGAQSDEVFINRARAYRAEGTGDMAASILEFLLARDSQNHLALVWSAKFAEEDGNPQLAMELFKRAARVAPPRSSWPGLASQGMLEAKVSVTSE